jgi:two-component system, cell cycle response regulator
MQMSVTLRVGRKTAAGIATLGAAVVATFVALCLALPSVRHGSGLELLFGGLAALACVVIVVRPVAVRAERAAWAMFALAIAFNTVTEVLEIPSPGGVAGVAGVVFGIATFPVAIAALVMMIRARLGRLRAIAWLDGMTGALVVMTILAITILGPAAHSADINTVKLAYPLADVLILGIVAAASAEDGWRVDGWLTMGVALAVMTVGDCVSAAHTAHPGSWSLAVAAALWLAFILTLAVSAWMPVPSRPDERQDARGWVPVTLSVMMLALLLISTIDRGSWGVSIGLAAAGMVVVTARFAVTLRQNAAVLRLARTEATTDSLTGLRNRRRLVRDLEEVLAQCTPERPCALAMFDLNGFKSYNDTYGHPAGDALLETLGTRLAAAVAGSAAAYRMGGDEFCVLIGADAKGVHGIVDRAREALSETTRRQTVTAASGLALLPADAATASEALRLADLRMYEDKTQGRIGPARQVTQTLMLALQERNIGLPSSFDGVAELAVAVARRLGVPSTEHERIRLAAQLANVGKIAVPDSVLTKPGPLTDSEWRLLRGHTLVGQRIIEAAPALVDVGKLVRSLHERVDGRGYPDGLAGDEIPIGARIIAVCNSHDAMVSARAYRAALTHEQALDELRRRAGSEFDPDVVRAFLEVVDEHRGAGRPGGDAGRPGGDAARSGGGAARSDGDAGAGPGAEPAGPVAEPTDPVLHGSVGRASAT